MVSGQNRRNRKYRHTRGNGVQQLIRSGNCVCVRVCVYEFVCRMYFRSKYFRRALARDAWGKTEGGNRWWVRKILQYTRRSTVRSSVPAFPYQENHAPTISFYAIYSRKLEVLRRTYSKRSRTHTHTHSANSFVSRAHVHLYGLWVRHHAVDGVAHTREIRACSCL